MRKILFIIIALFSNFLMASESARVSVSVSIDGKPDYLIRQTAKVKAQQLAIDRLPLLVIGNETLTDKGFTEDIQALMIGSVDVFTVSESWDRTKNTYNLSADVSLREEDAIKLLTKVKGDLNAQKKLKDAYDKIEKMVANGLDRDDYLTVRQEMLKIKSGSILRPTIAETLIAKQEFFADSVEILKELHIQPMIDNSTMTLLDVTETTIKYEFRLGGDGDFSIHVFLEKHPVLKGDRKTKKIGVREMVDVCIVSDLGMHKLWGYRNHRAPMVFTYDFAGNQDVLDTLTSTLRLVPCYT